MGCCGVTGNAHGLVNRVMRVKIASAAPFNFVFYSIQKKMQEIFFLLTLLERSSIMVIIKLEEIRP